MIGGLRRLLGRLLPEPRSDAAGPSPELAAAVLLVEMARADHRLDPREDQEIQRQLQASFGLDERGAAELLASARQLAEESVSLHEFTRSLHSGLDYREKLRIVQMLWQVALADRELDKYEDYLVGKVAGLMYVSRGDVIRLRQQVLDSLPPPPEG
ncbi:MAG: TerB family tellurite resistance protein [Gammaproteobacteria bacterium]|nr:MAG: TerB family tellurite resistance protein [Gammaproteobacteria bacterium]